MIPLDNDNKEYLKLIEEQENREKVKNTNKEQKEKEQLEKDINLYLDTIKSYKSEISYLVQQNSKTMNMPSHVKESNKAMWTVSSVFKVDKNGEMKEFKSKA